MTFSQRSPWKTIFLFAVVITIGNLALMPELMAQGDTETAEEAANQGVTVWTLIQEGGWAMIPLALCSVAMLALILFNMIQLTRERFVPVDLRQSLLEHMHACRVRSAIEVASASPSFLGRMLAVALPKIDATDPETLGREHVEDAVADFTIRENRAHMTMIGYLSVVAQVAPMLGLLGTVSGMIGAFNILRNLKSPDASVLAGNISEALVTTATGLCIAIPALIAFFFLRNRLNRLVAEAHLVTSELIDASLNTLNADQQLAKVPEGLAS